MKTAKNKRKWFVVVITSADGRRLCFYLCLSVCLSVCLSARLLRKVMNKFLWLFWRDGACSKDQSLTFWPSRITIRIQDFLKDIYSRLCLVSFICQVAALVSAEVCALLDLLVSYVTVPFGSLDYLFCQQRRLHLKDTRTFKHVDLIAFGFDSYTTFGTIVICFYVEITDKWSVWV